MTCGRSAVDSIGAADIFNTPHSVKAADQEAAPARAYVHVHMNTPGMLRT